MFFIGGTDERGDNRWFYFTMTIIDGALVVIQMNYFCCLSLLEWRRRVGICFHNRRCRLYYLWTVLCIVRKSGDTKVEREEARYRNARRRAGVLDFLYIVFYICDCINYN